MLKIKKIALPDGKNISKYLYEHRVPLLQCIPALVIFLLAVYRLADTGQPILFNDEIGYWSNSAFMMGDDWTSVTGRINYYSYGYSLLLIPLRMLADVFYWGWDSLYHAAIVLNGIFLVMSYVIALKLAKRYLPEMNTLVRTAACFTICTYSSYIVYAHIAWTECTLLFFFWVFLYVMMRMTDHPTVWNHAVFAVVSFYLYTVHQRALGIVVTAVLIVLCMRLMRINRLKDTAVFLGSMYLCGLIHAMIKGNLQHVNYLGGDPMEFSELLGYAFNRTSYIVLAAGILLLMFLYLLEKRKYGMIVALLAVGIALTAGMFHYWGKGAAGGDNSGVVQAVTGQSEVSAADDGTGALAAKPVERRISVNDFSGQWGVVRDIFTGNGLIRLGISIVGKWFYLASVSGFVICWGIAGLFKNFFILCKDIVSHKIGRRREQDTNKTTVTFVESATQSEKTMAENVADMPEEFEEIPAQRVAMSGNYVVPVQERIWFLGLLAAWLSTFMISAIYKEGFYKNDDLFNGRYVEFTIGFLLLYSLNCLTNDKKWVRKALLVMVLYIAAGHLCQYAIDELGRTEFELAHCVMFGRVIWNYEVPVGKVRALEEYIFPLGIWFLVILKLAREKIPRVAVLRTILALMIPVVVWSHLGRTIVDRYVVVRNEKQAEPLPQFASWINVLGSGSKQRVYYILDSSNQRYAGALQYMLQDESVTAAWLSEVPFAEDAFYVVRQSYVDAEVVEDNCEVIMYSRGYALLINKNQELMEKWKPFAR
ncbi:MAG: hypothetical protein HDR04_07625 [Lachnospiraceae bacterium]|nr:hypothetical protein [Lachnospiraceae bacterium]